MPATNDDEVEKGNYTSAGAAVGGLGAVGLLAGAVLTYTDLGDPSMVEARGMVLTSLVLCLVGYGLWWAGNRP